MNIRAIAFLLLLITAVFAGSCDKGPAIHPGLQLKKGDRFFVEMEVKIEDQSSLITANLSDEMQRFTIGYNWEVLDQVSDTEYLVRSTITSFDSRTRMRSSYDDGVVLKPATAEDSAFAGYHKQPLDSVLKNLVSQSFEFRITKKGAIDEVHGADSAIYRSFAKVYSDTAGAYFLADYNLVKSFCGNSSFANFFEPFFGSFTGEDGWHSGDDFANKTRMHEPLETVGEDYEFFSLNKWDCRGKDSLGRYELVLKGEFANSKDRQRNNLGFDLHVNGLQNGTIHYDTVSFVPQDGLLDQRYEISSGMRNIIFNFKLTSFKVKRSIRLKIRKAAA